ncbi:MAG: molybdopterin oxidoreductase [Candidatus Binatia bacterium]|nr:MAG: molybdopterin oxidoreductase [Candidatus Binatia bacterium]
MDRNGTTFEVFRRRLAGRKGREFLRELEELAGSEEFRHWLGRECAFPLVPLRTEMDRRQFLGLAAASLALAGLCGCTRQPLETIVPYRAAPEEIVPGRPLYFATAVTLGGFAVGVLVESHMGRPTKIEGNPDHPASLGGCDAWTQAAILDLYDPDRAQAVTYLHDIRPWRDFRSFARSVFAAQKEKKGRGLRILTGTVTSPTLASQLRAIERELPEARWHAYEPVNRDAELRGCELAFGRPLSPVYRFDRARVVVSLDADFLFRGPARNRYARDFARARRRGIEEKRPLRFYAFEPSPTVTGSVADHRFSVRASALGETVRALASAVGVGPPSEAEPPRWLRLVARDLGAARGESIVVAGDEQPAEVHAWAQALNVLLGNVGRTVFYVDPPEGSPLAQGDSLRELVEDLEAGRVDVLWILGGNPVYDAPADREFGRALRRASLRIYWGLHENETSVLCHWHVPAAHELESWSDTRAFDGTATVLQPLIEPLYGGKTAHEVLAAFSEEAPLDAREIVRREWSQRYPGVDFEKFWRKSLHDGVVPGTAFDPVAPSLRPGWTEIRPGKDPGGLEVVFRPDPTVYDGRFATNAWLQELPKPLTKLTWDNVVCVAPGLAERHGIENGDVVLLELEGRRVEAAAWILPGQAPDSVVAFLGYGRERAGLVGSGRGYSAYSVRSSRTAGFAAGIALRKLGRRVPLASTSLHHSMEGRPIVRAASFEEFSKNPDFARELEPEPESSLYPPHPYEGYAWGMVIDLASCIGCGACEVACQAENNIPVVGKEQVGLGREMNWIRVDRYFEGSPETPEIYHQPVPCMHCENAPCEVVCPVAATVHSHEGLNEMVYNRCVGTRYCSNNCPYKVRRFNFLLYADWATESLKLQRNPDVTVRSRGVMEKCTYCVQRINERRIQAKKEGRKIRDGEILTACQQACPSEAIVFGDVNDPGSRVSRLRRDPRNYSLLAHLGTRPRTTYLAVVRNPNPSIGRTSNATREREPEEGGAET